MYKRTAMSLMGTTLLGILVATSACGGSPLSYQEAQKALTSTQLAQTTLQTQVVAAQRGLTSSIKINTSGTTSTYSGTLTGPGGGTATISGTSSITEASTVIDLTMSFSHWQDPVQNLTLDGDLKLHEEVSGSSTSVKESGELAVSGAVSGTASFDITVTEQSS